MARVGTVEFIALRLNYFRSESWAVVERPSGALAVNCKGEFLMRLSEGDARDLARALTEDLIDREPSDEATPACRLARCGC